MSYQPWVGLPNILCREFVVPELLQHDCHPQALADEVLAQLDNTAGAERLAERFTELHLLLKRDTAYCATDAISKVLEA
jgi:lipid-A-disaccharide synthase